jgi:hypothetical protein
VVRADGLGPVIPRVFAPAPGRSIDGQRIEAPLSQGRGAEKTWVYGGVRIRDGKAVTTAASSRNSAYCQEFLAAVAKANPRGKIVVITDSLSGHTSFATRTWLKKHPRITQVFIPVGASRLNPQEAWRRMFRHHALAGQTFATPDEIDYATRLATARLNAHAQPWIWGRPDPTHRVLRRRFTYML